MTRNYLEREPVREFRLEGGALFVMGGLLLAALLGAFLLGRWYERQRGGPHVPTSIGAAAKPGAPPAEVPPPAEVAAEANYFDTLEGAEKQAEPAREVPNRQPQVAVAEVTPAAEAGGGGEGPYFVQVFAGRDRGAAEGLIAELKQRAYDVRVVTDRRGQSSLFKVRVGGYASQDAAREAARALQDAGYSGAWVTRVD